MENNFLDSNIIFENIFAKEILSLMTINTQKLILGETYIPNKKEIFITDTFNCFSEISNKFCDINYSYLHIINYPNSIKYRKIFPIKDYNIYHTEIYTIKIIALFDRFLHLINLLYELNLIKNWLTIKNIKKSKKVGANILIILEKFNDNIQPIRDWQNNFKHEWSLDIPELEKVSTYELLLNHSDDLDKKQKDLMNLYIKLTYKKYKWIQKEKLLDNTKKIADFINKILDELFPIFEDRFKKIKE